MDKKEIAVAAIEKFKQARSLLKECDEMLDKIGVKYRPVECGTMQLFHNGQLLADILECKTSFDENYLEKYSLLSFDYDGVRVIDLMEKGTAK